jgi:hypothetical protein
MQVGVNYMSQKKTGIKQERKRREKTHADKKSNRKRRKGKQ